MFLTIRTADQGRWGGPCVVAPTVPINNKVMQQDAADTNPFKKLAQQERERERLNQESREQEGNGSPSLATAQDTTGSTLATEKHGASVVQLRPPIPVAPVLIGGASGDANRRQSTPHQRLPAETSGTYPVHRRPAVETCPPNMGQENSQTNFSPRSPNEESGDDYSNFVDSYADSHSGDEVDSDSSSSSDDDVLQPIDSSALHQLLPQTPLEEITIGNHSGRQSVASAYSASGKKLPFIETALDNPLHANSPADMSSGYHFQDTTVPHLPPRSNAAQHSPSPALHQSLPEDSFITIDSPVLENSSRLLDFDQSPTSSAPMPPLRPLPPRENPNALRNRLSNLDPGSSSIIPTSHSYYGDYGTPSTPDRGNQPRPNVCQDSDNFSQSPKLPKRPISSNSSARLSPDSPVQNYQYPNNDFRRFSGAYDVDPNRSESDLTPVVSTPVIMPTTNELSYIKPHIKENYSLHNNTAPSLSPQNQSVAEPPSQSSPYGEHPELRASLPIITVSTPENESPRLPRKPQLPKRPPRLSSGSASAYELLENFGRRSSTATVPDRSKVMIQQTPIVPIAPIIPAASNDDLDIESLRSLGITEEMIKQQKEIEARIQRDNLREKELRNQLIERERLENSQANSTISSNNTGGQSISNMSMTSEISNGHISNNSHESEDVPDDISQLEIPTNISRTTTTSADNASEVQSAISSSPSSTDLIANEELTEEEFLSLLPPAPKYTPTPSETEISIPNGKAIDMMTINENHPKENPPEYTPVSDALKKIINRPQFSQTGGDSLSLRRRQQQEQQQQQQLHHHHRHNSQSGQQTSSTSRHRSGSGTSTRRTSSRSAVEPARTTTRRLPPTRSMARYSS